MVVPNPLNAAASGLNTNFNGGSYKNGVSYDILKKLQVVDTYQELLKTRNGFREPSLREVAREAHVSHTYVKKVLDGLNSGSGILDPQLNK
jgi:AraC-like DNA-binding protein